MAGGRFGEIRKPVFGREGDAPHVTLDLKFQSDLEKLAYGARALYPNYPSRNRTRRNIGVVAGDVEHNHRILRHIMLGLVFAAVAVDHNRRGAFLEGLTEGVDSRDRHRDGLSDARASTLLRAGIV